MDKYRRNKMSSATGAFIVISLVMISVSLIICATSIDEFYYDITTEEVPVFIELTNSYQLITVTEYIPLSNVGVAQRYLTYFAITILITLVLAGIAVIYYNE